MNQPRVVTARINSLVSLREERVKNDNTLHIPGSFPFQMPNGERKIGRFKSETGAEVETLPIVGQRVFNLNNQIDRDNWDLLQVLHGTDPRFQELLLLEDPEEKADKEIKRTKDVLRVVSIISDNEDNHELLAKVYRRLIGPANGITPKQVLKGLTELAMTSPDRFLNKSGKMIFEERTFEILSLIDVGIEKGFFHLDKEGFIKLSNGEVYANDIDKAAYRLESDTNTMDNLKYHISEATVVKPAGFTPQIEDSDFLKLMNTVGTPADAVDSIVDFGLDADMKLEKDLEDKLPKLIEGNFIEEKQIQGGHKRYIIEGLQRKFKFEELAGYFKMNQAQFEDLVSRAGI